MVLARGRHCRVQFNQFCCDLTLVPFELSCASFACIRQTDGLAWMCALQLQQCAHHSLSVGQSVANRGCFGCVYPYSAFNSEPMEVPSVSKFCFMCTVMNMCAFLVAAAQQSIRQCLFQWMTFDSTKGFPGEGPPWSIVSSNIGSFQSNQASLTWDNTVTALQESRFNE